MLLIATNKLIAIFVPIFAALVGTLIAIWSASRSKRGDRSDRS